MIMNDFLKRDRWLLTISFVSAVVVFLLSYFTDNSSYSFVGGPSVGQRIEQITQFLGNDDEVTTDDLLFINVAYDRELVSVDDEFGLPKGNIDITDRSKLLSLLEQLNRSGYKEIVIDISFTNQYHTDVDSSLFALIASMDNIVIAKSEKTLIADEILNGKARYSEYHTHIAESNFVKYAYIKNGEPTLPYQMYLDLYGNEISSFGGFYFFNGRLATKSVVLRHPIKLWNKFSGDKSSADLGEMLYYNLGSDLLDLGVDIASLAKDKIVVVGDLTENDLHDTYMGKIAGPVININAFCALVNGDIIIPYSEIIFLLLLYSAITFLIIKGKGNFIFTRHFKSKLWQLVLSLMSVSTVLVCVSAVMYILFKLDVSVLIPSLWFSWLIVFMKYKR